MELLETISLEYIYWNLPGNLQDFIIVEQWSGQWNTDLRMNNSMLLKDMW